MRCLHAGCGRARSPTHPLRRAPRSRLRDCLDHVHVRAGPPGGFGVRVLPDAAARRIGRAVAPVVETDSFDLIRHYVRHEAAVDFQIPIGLPPPQERAPRLPRESRSATCRRAVLLLGQMRGQVRSPSPPRVSPSRSPRPSTATAARDPRLGARCGRIPPLHLVAGQCDSRTIDTPWAPSLPAKGLPFARGCRVHPTAGGRHPVLDLDHPILVLSVVGLTYEIAAGRVLAPFSARRWSPGRRVIATVLAGFSLGSALGGLVAERDRRRPPRARVRAALVATALLMALSPDGAGPALYASGARGHRGHAAHRRRGFLFRRPCLSACPRRCLRGWLWRRGRGGRGRRLALSSPPGRSARSSVRSWPGSWPSPLVGSACHIRGLRRGGPCLRALRAGGPPGGDGCKGTAADLTAAAIPRA